MLCVNVLEMAALFDIFKETSQRAIGDEQTIKKICYACLNAD